MQGKNILGLHRIYYEIFRGGIKGGEGKIVACKLLAGQHMGAALHCTYQYNLPYLAIKFYLFLGELLSLCGL